VGSAGGAKPKGPKAKRYAFSRSVHDEGAVHHTRRRAPLRLVEAMPFRPWAGTPERRVLRAYRSWRTGGEVKGEAERGG